MADPKSTAIEPVPTETEKSGPNWLKIGLIAVAVFIAIILVGTIYGAVANVGWILRVLAALRDLVILVLVLLACVIAAVLVVLVFKLNELIDLLRHEIAPLLHDARDTLTTVRGTATFVSRNVARPVIQVTSFITGARTLLGEISGLSKALRRTEIKSAIKSDGKATIKAADKAGSSKKE